MWEYVMSFTGWCSMAYITYITSLTLVCDHYCHLGCIWHQWGSLNYPISLNNHNEVIWTDFLHLHVYLNTYVYVYVSICATTVYWTDLKYVLDNNKIISDRFIAPLNLLVLVVSLIINRFRLLSIIQNQHHPFQSMGHHRGFLSVVIFLLSNLFTIINFYKPLIL